ncbi:tryptophan-rich sensory protein [Proteiniclasticum sp. BAD-10]|uniref:Tryptophan-rich sensory protein n=2 Tax=Proteiniclasticum sediminis TaxID=2804028 RepID=A0A941CS68_9CLOT|nr:tryptophan-rich sensory protein [Proteiniclasticum sediminis]
MIMEKLGKAWINGIFFALTLVVNTLGAIGLINGLSQKEISDRYVTLITPSSSTFSIWSVIYSLLLVSIIVMIVKKNDPYYQKAVDEISFLFRLSCIFNIVWIVTFSFVLVEVSVLFIFAFVVNLAILSLKLLKIQEKRRWLLPLTFGLYSGWLFIATVVNIAAALVKMKWNGFGIGAEIWSILILAISVVLVGLVVLRIKNAAFPLSVAWAYFGIYQFLNMPSGFKGAYPLLEIVALGGSVVLIGIAAIQLYRNQFAVIPAASNIRG